MVVDIDPPSPGDAAPCPGGAEDYRLSVAAGRTGTAWARRRSRNATKTKARPVAMGRDARRRYKRSSMAMPPSVIYGADGHGSVARRIASSIGTTRGVLEAKNTKPPRKRPRGLRPVVSARYFFLAGFGLALVLGAFLVPHPQAMVIPPLRTSGYEETSGAPRAWWPPPWAPSSRLF
jgi:hypothetical protein